MFVTVVFVTVGQSIVWQETSNHWQVITHSPTGIIMLSMVVVFHWLNSVHH